MNQQEFTSIYREKVLDHIVLPNKIKENYVLEACLKQTSDRSIYRIVSKANGEKYILKQVPEKHRHMLLKEYTMSVNIDHPSIPKAIDIFDYEDNTYFIRDYIEGYTLYEIVENKGCYSEKEAIQIGMALCDIFHYLHNLNPPIIYRDIKPQNIVVTEDGTYKLIDLETSRSYKEDESEDTVFMGTKSVAAPEQFGYQQTDSRSDIYGLGMLMVYLVMGDFSIKTHQLHQLSHGFMRVIKKCLAFDPEKRYKHVGVLKRHLRYCLHQKKLLKRTITGVASFIVVGLIALWGIMSIRSSSSEKTVSFIEPLIEKAVRQELQLDDKAPIYVTDLEQITQILICGEEIITDWNRHRQYCKLHYINEQQNNTKGQIKNLQDISKMKNLKRLILDNQNINNIDSLKGLPLEKLSISGNRIEDITPLTSSEKIKQLWMEDNKVEDISPLASLTNLSVLDIGYNSIRSIDTLEELPIEELQMNETSVDQFTVFKNMPLQTLVVSRLTDKGLDIIGNKKELRKLIIYGSGIDSIEPFQNLTDLTYIDLFNNNLTDLAGIEKLMNLEHIGLGRNDIKDVSPLTKLKYLKFIDIEALPIEDLSVLNNIENLECVFCDTPKTDELKEIFQDKRVNILH